MAITREGHAVAIVVSLLWAGPGLASSAVVGTFTQGAAATQAVPHALGEQPKAGIFWSAGATAADVVEPNAALMIGLTDGARSYVSGSVADDAQPAVRSARWIGAQLLTFDTSSMTPLAKAALTSWDSSAFSLAWSPNDGVPRQIHYLLIGGADVSARAFDFLTPTTAGAFAVTGVGFRPDVVVAVYAATAATALPSYANAAHPHLSMASARAQWTLGFNVQPANTNRYFLPHFVAVIQAGAFQAAADLTSFDADGFTLGVTTPATVRIMTLAIAGSSLDVGVFSRDAGVQAVAGVGFPPQVVLLATGLAGGSALPVTDAQCSIGAASPTASAVASMRATMGLPTSVRRVDGELSVVTQAETVSPDTAMLDGRNADGFTLRWTNSTGAPIELGYLAVAVFDAGTVDPRSDAGFDGPRRLNVGCGCASEGGTLAGAMALLAALRRRRTPQFRSPQDTPPRTPSRAPAA